MMQLHDTTSEKAYLRRDMRGRGIVLVIESNSDVAGLVTDVLQDEDFDVAWLADSGLGALQREVGRLDLVAVLLDGSDARGYGQSWSAAGWLHARYPEIPVINNRERTERTTRAAS